MVCVGSGWSTEEARHGLKRGCDFQFDGAHPFLLTGDVAMGVHHQTGCILRDGRRQAMHSIFVSSPNDADMHGNGKCIGMHYYEEPTYGGSPKGQ